uniref:DNA-directed RNA polymerases I, II, and III subunit RPABC2 (RPB6, POLR2F) n=1 Tax=uncultured marine group II/III euryarchaeote AD1000_88_G11 TaxID=1457822 RepID=A0A075FYY8_9EURY|nr:DNA-directed RNA polymerases I, II, and III subunit RPABC2 (RPB6, POLR2F) [uncultured marine group II/III euryarchaeote AD1000_88_G11]
MEEEDIFNKIEDRFGEEKLMKIHSYLKPISNDELQSFSRVVRDTNGDIIDDLHKTLPILSKYEKTRILGLRAKQINSGSELFIKLKDNNIIDGYGIALLELKVKAIPFIIQRPIPNGGFEYWKVSDLMILD